MRDDDGDAGREQDHRAAHDLRDELMDTWTDSVARARRLEEALESAGIGPELLRGTGDLVYGIVVQQMLLGARALRRTQELGDRLARQASRSAVRHGRRLVKLKVASGSQDALLEEVTNHFPFSGRVQVTHDVQGADGQSATDVLLLVRTGRDELSPGGSTSVLVEAHTSKNSGGLYRGTIEVSLERNADGPVLLQVLELELWVTRA